ncbi:unnamed protein product [Adineta steineri]|uniref:G-protein coupled receptors family 1 profile domain-containing protein n=1 Tax=Adineta steineri TaxID=433720 RepID=A0A814RPB0_9BILA|nr:unnamed protein product [Adineta steineri]CAF3957588.1 unnamed protein product [Adineta steineri]
MASNASNQSDNISDDNDVFTIPILEHTIKFYILLTLQVPSLACVFFILYHFKWRRLHSQIYGILIIENSLIITIELPFTLFFLYRGDVHTETICPIWISLNYSLFYLSIALMAWTSFERYLFIYYEKVITKHYLLLHYFPIACLILYGPLFYLSLVYLYKCQSYYDIHAFVCGGTCYQYELALGLFDWIGNIITPIFITFFINIIIVIRHFLQKHRMREAIVSINRHQQWRRSAKMTVQLLATSMLYIIGWVPYITIGLIQIFENTEQLASLLSTVFAFFPYMQTLFLPIICLLFMPDIRHKFYSTLIELYAVKIFRRGNRIQIIENQSMMTARPPLASKQPN